MLAFSRFFDSLAYCQGELINYSNIARDCGVDAKTVREYFHIMEDTLIGTLIFPYSGRKSRDLITQMPKFYMFDVGVGGYIAGRIIPDEKGEQFGRALEHFIYMELKAYSSYSGKDFDICYWRTKSGLEVDFVLGKGDVCIEVKGTDSIKPGDLKGIKAFVEDYRPVKAIVVCNEKEPRLSEEIYIAPWRNFLEKLWNGEIL
jgi:predicted AAA+ superfamily ATPase